MVIGFWKVSPGETFVVIYGREKSFAPVSEKNNRKFNRLFRKKERGHTFYDPKKQGVFIVTTGLIKERVDKTLASCGFVTLSCVCREK